MFTGIIQNQGTVTGKKKQSGQIHFAFRFRDKEKGLKTGESIAVDGVCLTVVKFADKTFEADVIDETLRATNLGRLEAGDKVNLERSLRVGDQIGGHFVTGHVDGVGRLQRIQKRGANYALQIQAPADIIQSLALKGSIAIDGISLTVQAVRANTFNVAIIPLTLRETTLGLRKEGDILNLEIDLTSRYLKNLANLPVGAKAKSRLTLKKLKAQGF